MTDTTRPTVFVAMPAYDTKVTAACCQSLIQSIALASEHYEIHVRIAGGGAVIARARNLLVAEFMHGGYDNLFFIDNDIGWQPDAFLRLLNHPEELVCGVYPFRSDDYKGQWPVRWFDDQAEATTNEHGLFEVVGGPTGFMRIKRSCIDKMVEANKDKFVHDHQAPLKTMVCLFGHTIHRGEFVGEDYYFCHLWRGIGGKVWIDPDIAFEHMGDKTWKGNIAAAMRAHTEKLRAESTRSPLIKAVA